MLAIIGESGSGKSVSSRALMGLLPPTAPVTGSARIDGTELVGMPERGDAPAPRRETSRWCSRTRPARSTRPCGSARQITEAIRAHADIDRAAAQGAGASSCCRLVRLPAPRAALPRVPAPALGRDAAAGDDRDRARGGPAACSSPTRRPRALDVTTQAQIMELLVELQRAARHGGHPDQPRPRAGRQLRRRRDRDVRRAGGRVRADAGRCSRTSGCRTPARCWARSRGWSGSRTRRCR